MMKNNLQQPTTDKVDMKNLIKFIVATLLGIIIVLIPFSLRVVSIQFYFTS